jgi:hypothetical protein
MISSSKKAFVRVLQAALISCVVLWPVSFAARADGPTYIGKSAAIKAANRALERINTLHNQQRKVDHVPPLSFDQFLKAANIVDIAATLYSRPDNSCTYRHLLLDSGLMLPAAYPDPEALDGVRSYKSLDDSMVATLANKIYYLVIYDEADFHSPEFCIYIDAKTGGLLLYQSR